MKSSFVRKGKVAASTPAMPGGTRLSAQNGALQISSGLADFDGTFMNNPLGFCIITISLTSNSCYS